jgi:RimJ/RimL family protein N-acetyltransferase
MATLEEALLIEVPETLETGRLRLAANHAGAGRIVNEAFVESHAQLKPWMPWAKEAMSVEGSEKHCREMQAKWYARQILDFCFYRKTDGIFVGKGGLHTIDWGIPKFEIGYWIRTSCAGQGFATEATLALVDLARRPLGARRIEITSDARNAASRRVAEKSGFALEGILRSSRRDNAGELADSCMYARTF